MAQRKSSAQTTALIAELGAAALILAAVKFAYQIPAVRAALALDNSLTGRWQMWGAWAGWVVFSLYWEIAKPGSREVQRVESGFSRGIHVFLANIGLLLVAAPILGLGRFLPIQPLVMTAGVAIELAGLAFAIWARRHLGRNWSGEISIKVDHKLIRTGPYKHLRHPIYTGLLAMYAGCALVNDGWLALIGVALGAFAYIRKLRLEEAGMDAAFGAAYDAYRKESWAIVPFVY